MGLDTGQSSIGKREATLRIAVRTFAREGDERMDAVGMDARRGRNRLHEVLQKSEGQIPGGTARYLPAVNLPNRGATGRLAIRQTQAGGKFSRH